MTKYTCKYALGAEDVSVAYGKNCVVSDVDLNIEQGTMTGLIGPNGAGKSTLLKACLGLIPCLSGHVLFYNQPFHKVRQDVAYVPQTDSVNWDFPTTVGDVCLMGRYVHHGWIRRCNARDKQIAAEALDMVGMSEFAGRQVSKLSGGQKQRVFLARALAQRPSMFILDEPLTGVDQTTEDLIIQILKEYRDQGKTIIAVHHDLATAGTYFDHICMIDKSIKAFGPTQTCFTQENLRATFGGYTTYDENQKNHQVLNLMKQTGQDKDRYIC